MIDDAALKARLKDLRPNDDAEALLEQAIPALRTAAEAGEWVEVRFPRAGAVGNPEKSRELDRLLDAGLEGDDAGTVALQAVARAVAALAADSDDATGQTLNLGGDTYELKLHIPSRGGRAKLRLRNPDAAPADEADAETEAAAG